MNILLPLVLALAGSAWAGQAAAQVTFFERNDYQGRSFTTDDTVENFERHGFNGRASSATVQGGRQDRWEVCEERRFGGRCVVLRPGQYGSLQAMGLQGRVASVRAVERVGRGNDRRDAAAPPVATGQIDFYEQEGFRGRSFTAVQPTADFRGSGFNDRASSAVVTGSAWEVCQNTGYNGPCVMLRPGQYPSLAAVGLNDRISSARGADDRIAAAPPPAPSRIVLYENDGFQGRSVTANGAVEDFRGSGFNDRASSVVVSGGRYEVCNDSRFGGSCVVLRPGQYPSLGAMGLNDRVSSVRPVGRDVRVDERRFAPLPVVAQDYGRRSGERLYEATITSVRAVVEDSGQRCWVEPQQVSQAPQERAGPNVGGALLGAVLGGILGHQVGGGTGRDVATGIGVVAGAAIGSNVGRGEDGQQVVQTQNVQRCSPSTGPARPAYWDVTYNFRNQEYRVQMNRPPGRTITVNEHGEPRA